MRITQEADYAFRIVRCLTTADGEKMGSSKISEFAGIPHRFTFKILRKLTHAGVTDSIRGKGGGYRLAKAPKNITLLELVEIIDGGKPFQESKASGGSRKFLHQNLAANGAIDVDLKLGCNRKSKA